MHVPGAGRTAFGAEAAMQAKVFVFGHDPLGLDGLNIDRLGRDWSRARQHRRNSPSGHWARKRCNRSGKIDAGVALDTQGAEKTVCTSQFRQRCTSPPACFEIESELDLGLNVLQRDRILDVRHPKSAIESNPIVIRPFVDAHLLADEIVIGVGRARTSSPRQKARSRSRPHGHARRPR